MLSESPFLTEKRFSSKESKPYETGDFEINLPTPHKGQAEVLRSKTKYRVVASGRRFGKSLLSIIACTIRLFKGQHIWHCSPTNQNAKRIFREFIKIFRAFPESYVTINKTDMRIDLLFNDAFIEFKSLSEPENLRGEGLDFVVVDEAAFCQDNIWDEILAPMLLTTDGDALFISSTNGKNWFWRMYQYGLDELEPDYQSFHYTSYDNPIIDPKKIDDIKRKTPSYVFDREYMAAFEDSGGSVFKEIYKIVRNFEIDTYPVFIRDEVIVCENEAEYLEWMLNKNSLGECTIVCGIDFAQKDDFTVITVFDLETNSLIEYYRVNKMLWEDIRDVIKDINQKWRPLIMLAEENNSLATIEQLQKDGLPIEGFHTNTSSKPKLINKLAIAIEQRELSIPNDKMLLAELSAYEITQSKSGNIKYGSPRGLHDDIVISFALSNWCRDSVLSGSAFDIITVDFA